MQKTNKLFVGIVVGVFLAAFCLVVGGKISTLMDEKTTQDVSSEVDEWVLQYPFNTTIDEVQPEIEEESLMDKWTRNVSKFSTIGNNWSKLIVEYNNIAKAGYVIQSTLTDPAIGAHYIKLKNGYWIESSTEISMNDAITTIAPYSSLHNYLNEQGIPFLYFYAPYKDCDVDDEYPDSVVSYNNINIDKYLSAMDSYGISYIDFRKEIHDAGLDHYSLFYKTDHHWTVETGLWASSVIAKYVSNTLGTAMLNPYELGEYQAVTYSNAEFGSAGNGVTRFVESPEDFTVLYPLFETNYRVEVPSLSIDTIGSFEEVFVDQENLQEITEEGGGAAYGCIMYGNTPYEKITNLNNPDGPKILMIRDSFSIVVVPYLAAVCSELVLIDTRSGNGNFTGSVIECINQFQPDIVLALQYIPQELILNK